MMEQCKKMCKSISIEEKCECVSKMMPNCLDSILNALDNEESQIFAKDMQEKLNQIFDKYLSKNQTSIK